MNTRNIIALGESGVGKSKILSRLLGKKNGEFLFNSSAAILGVTQQIENKSNTAETISSDDSIVQFNLEGYDTPGLFDPMGNSTKYLDEILVKIKEVDFHQIIFIFEYDRLTDEFHKCLKALKLCMNDFNDECCTFIVNKIPNQDEQKAKLEEDTTINFDTQIKNMNNHICQALNYPFTKFFIFYNDIDCNNIENENTLKQIRQIVFNSTPFKSNAIKTWSQLVDYRKQIKENKSSQIDQLNSEITNLKNDKNQINANIGRVRGHYSYHILMFQTYGTRHQCIDLLNTLENSLRTTENDIQNKETTCANYYTELLKLNEDFQELNEFFRSCSQT